MTENKKQRQFKSEDEQFLERLPFLKKVEKKGISWEEQLKVAEEKYEQRANEFDRGE